MEHRTSDTAEASFLITSGFPPPRIDYSLPRYEFIFSDHTEAIREHSAKYLAGLARAEPSSFVRIFRKLNRIVRNHRQWEDD